MIDRTVVEMFGALGDPTRWLLVKTLSRRPNGDYVSALATTVQIRPSIATFHLKVLESVGLVTRLRIGKFVVYQVNQPALRLLGQAIDALSTGLPLTTATNSTPSEALDEDLRNEEKSA